MGFSICARLPPQLRCVKTESEPGERLEQGLNVLYDPFREATPDTLDAPQPGQTITLSERDFDRLVELIENPKPPTQALQEAMRDSQRLRDAHPDANS